MSSFIETPRFPSCVAYGATGGPKFSTNIVALASGREQRNIVWSQVRAEYDVGHRNRTIVEMDELRAFFYAVRGRAYGFRFKDYTDYEVSATEGFLVDDGGSPSAFKMMKRYTIGTMTYDRRIYKPVVGSVTCYLNGEAMPGWTVDYATGIVTGMHTGSPNYYPGAAVTWAGEFDVPVRFDVDHLDVSTDELNAYTWGSIKLVELRFD